MASSHCACGSPLSPPSPPHCPVYRFLFTFYFLLGNIISSSPYATTSFNFFFNWKWDIYTSLYQSKFQIQKFVYKKKLKKLYINEYYIRKKKKICMLRVGFEPTPFRTRTLIWRLRPTRPSQHHDYMFSWDSICLKKKLKTHHNHTKPQISCKMKNKGYYWKHKTKLIKTLDILKWFNLYIK